MWDFYHMLLLYNMGQEDVLVLPGLTYAKLLYPDGGAMFPPENKLFSPPDNFFNTSGIPTCRLRKSLLLGCILQSRSRWKKQLSRKSSPFFLCGYAVH